MGSFDYIRGIKEIKQDRNLYDKRLIYNKIEKGDINEENSIFDDIVINS